MTDKISSPCVYSSDLKPKLAKLNLIQRNSRFQPASRRPSTQPASRRPSTQNTSPNRAQQSFVQSTQILDHSIRKAYSPWRTALPSAETTGIVRNSSMLRERPEFDLDTKLPKTPSKRKRCTSFSPERNFIRENNLVTDGYYPRPQAAASRLSMYESSESEDSSSTQE